MQTVLKFKFEGLRTIYEQCKISSVFICIIIYSHTANVDAHLRNVARAIRDVLG